MLENPSNRFDLESMKTHTPEMGLVVGVALGSLHNMVVVGSDHMKSSPMMKEALISGILSEGADVIDIGVVPAPVLADTAILGDCGVFVTGSDEYNDVSGFVIYDKDGSPYTSKLYRVLETSSNYKSRKKSDVGRIHHYKNATVEYVGKVLRESESSSGCSMVVDCRCGVSSDTVPSVLDALGVEVLSLNGHGDADYIPKNLGITDREYDDLARTVGDTTGYIGIRINNSGSNLTLLDENGDVVDTWKTMAILVAYLKPKKLVLPLDFSSIVEDVFYGKIEIPVHTPHTSSEEEEPKMTIMGMSTSSVCDEFARQDADLAICETGFVLRGLNSPDSLRAAIALSHLSCENSIHRLVSGIPDLERDVKRIHVDCEPDLLSRELNATIPMIECKRYSIHKGWRVDLEEGWFLILPPINGEVELIAEAPDKAYLIGLMEIGENLIRTCSSGI